MRTLRRMPEGIYDMVDNDDIEEALDTDFFDSQDIKIKIPLKEEDAE